MSKDKKRPAQEPKTCTLELTPAAIRALRDIPRQDQVRIGTPIDSLSDNPRPPGSEKLQGAEDLHRVRLGDYRIIYTIKDANLVVVIITIGNRREVYRRRK